MFLHITVVSDLIKQLSFVFAIVHLAIEKQNVAYSDSIVQHCEH